MIDFTTLTRIDYGNWKNLVFEVGNFHFKLDFAEEITNNTTNNKNTCGGQVWSISSSVIPRLTNESRVIERLRRGRRCRSTAKRNRCSTLDADDWIGSLAPVPLLDAFWLDRVWCRRGVSRWICFVNFPSSYSILGSSSRRFHLRFLRFAKIEFPAETNQDLSIGVDLIPIRQSFVTTCYLIDSLTRKRVRVGLHCIPL